MPGHWEGDLIIGRNGKSAIGTLVERSTRFVILLHLPDGRDADQVRQAMTAIATLPDALRRSITWDQGKEMTQHAQFRIDTGVDIYFCDPHAPWQRDERDANGLLRQYFPKGTNLAVHDTAALQAAANSLNGRPRQTLNWMTPSEKLNEFLVENYRLRTDEPSPARQLIGDFAPKLVELTDDVLFGDVWERPGLSKRDRSLVTVSAPRRAEPHRAATRPTCVRAIDNGITEDELIEAITHLAFYSGWPTAMSAIVTAKKLFEPTEH